MDNYQMDRLLDPGILTNHGESPMESALKSEGGRKVMRQVAEKSKSLKASCLDHVCTWKEVSTRQTLRQIFADLKVGLKTCAASFSYLWA